MGFFSVEHIEKFPWFSKFVIILQCSLPCRGSMFSFETGNIYAEKLANPHTFVPYNFCLDGEVPDSFYIGSGIYS